MSNMQGGHECAWHIAREDHFTFADRVFFRITSLISYIDWFLELTFCKIRSICMTGYTAYHIVAHSLFLTGVIFSGISSAYNPDADKQLFLEAMAEERRETIVFILSLPRGREIREDLDPVAAVTRASFSLRP